MARKGEGTLPTVGLGRPSMSLVRASLPEANGQNKMGGVLEQRTRECTERSWGSGLSSNKIKRVGHSEPFVPFLKRSQ